MSNYYEFEECVYGDMLFSDELDESNGFKPVNYGSYVHMYNKLPKTHNPINSKVAYSKV